MGEKKDIPGAQYEEVVKKSRRKNKKTTKEESTEAGRSVYLSFLPTFVELDSPN